jgi:hypothetical protein
VELLRAISSVAALMLLISCGIILQQRTEIPDDSVTARPGVHFPYVLELCYRREGVGGNVHAPFSMDSYKYISCDYIVVQSLQGRLDAAQIGFAYIPEQLGYKPGTVRGYISFPSAEQVMLHLELDEGREIGKPPAWTPYRFNGTYRLVRERTTRSTGNDG